MKKLLLALVSLFIFLFSFGQYKYDVHVEMINANKETIGLLDQHIFTYNRYINENVISFSTTQNYSELFIDSLFVVIGVQPFMVIKDKTETNTIEKAGGNDCGAAELLCSNSSQTANSGGAGAQELNGTNQGCLSTEHQSSWYYLNIQTGGTLNMVIDPANNSDDYDFAIWGPFTAATADANCPPITSPIRCSWSAESDQTGLGPYWGQTSLFGCGFLGLSACYGWITPSDNSEGAGGDSWVSTLNVNANEIYILLVDNFSNSGQPYNMSFGGTSVLGCTPVELLYFEADKDEAGNVLQWKTETETNNDYFEIEWSVDPTDSNSWVKIATVNSKGSGVYNFLHDKYKRNDLNYYRLSQIDINGTRKELGIDVVDNSFKYKEILKVVNSLGQMVDLNTKGVIFIIYTNGQMERVVNY